MRQIILGIALCLIALWGPTALRATAAGAPAPAFELVTLTGESYSRDSLKGRPTLLIFWGTLVQCLSARAAAAVRILSTKQAGEARCGLDRIRGYKNER